MVVTSQDWLDAQYSVLGAVLISPELTAKVVGETSEADYSGQTLSVYRAIKAVFLEGKQADPVLVCSKLGTEYSDFLLQLMEVTPTAANIDQYIGLTKSRGQLVRLRSIGQALQAAESVEDAAVWLDRANKAMVQRGSVRITSMEQALEDFFQRHEARPEYLTWPIESLNNKLYAEAGDFIVLGGFPSDGKSAMALQMATHLAAKKRVGFFSLETSERKLFDRLMSAAANIPMSRLKTNSLTNEDWEAAAKISTPLTNLHLDMIPAAGMTVADIQAISFANHYDVIFVDYLQLIQGRGKDRFSIVTDVSIGLHTMAQSTGITVIALAQLNRPEKRKDGSVPEPTLSSLRESGQIEQDADIVFMLYRERLEDRRRNFLILKNKEGELGRMTLDFDGQTQTFAQCRSDQYRQTQRAIRTAAQQYERLPDDTPVPFEEDRQCKMAMS